LIVVIKVVHLAILVSQKCLSVSELQKYYHRKVMPLQAYTLANIFPFQTPIGIFTVSPCILIHWILYNN